MADYYGGPEIKVLRGLEPVRMRPGMYFGGTGASGKHQLAWELIGNALDQHVRGLASRIDITAEGEQLVVTDDGPGFQPARIESVFTTLHLGSTAPEEPHVHISPDLRGVGVGPVNAVSSGLAVESCHRGRRYAISFRRGEVHTPLRDLGPTDRSGVRIALMADPEIFASPGWNVAELRERMATLACLNPGLTIRLNGDTFSEPAGLAALIGCPDTAIVIRGSHDDVQVEVALSWCPERPSVRGFLSQFDTVSGTHMCGYYDALAKLGSRRAPRVTRPVWRELFNITLAAVVHVGLYEPKFGDPTRDRLTNPEARTAVRRVMLESLRNDPRFDRILARLFSA